MKFRKASDNMQGPQSLITRIRLLTFPAVLESDYNNIRKECFFPFSSVFWCVLYLEWTPFCIVSAGLVKGRNSSNKNLNRNVLCRQTRSAMRLFERTKRYRKNQMVRKLWFDWAYCPCHLVRQGPCAYHAHSASFLLISNLQILHNDLVTQLHGS